MPGTRHVSAPMRLARARALRVLAACPLASCTLALSLALSWPAQAVEYRVGDVELSVRGLVGAGTAIRTEAADPLLVPAVNGAAAGVFGLAAGGRNQDDGNLNFRRGDAVSTVARAFIDVEAKYQNFGVHVGAMAWRDFVLTDSPHPWGNLPNNLTPFAPLGETSDDAYGRFAGAALLNANVYGNFDVGGHPLHLRVGNQLMRWSVPSTIATGLSVINPLNNPALYRPGALVPDETLIPFPAAFARFGVTPALDVEAFYQFAFRRTDPLGCGTFYSTVDYVADRCDKVVVGAGLNDRQSLALAAFVKRAPDVEPDDAGQFGLGLGYKVEALATRFGAYYTLYHQRTGLIGAIKAGRPGVPVIPGDPDGLNPQYFVQYPEDINVFGANAITRLPGLLLFAEVAHRANQPLQLHSNDLTNAFLSNTAPSLLRAEIDALPFGARYAAYDRYGATDVVVGANRQFPGLLGASVLSLGAELGAKFVHDLPDPTVRRYGRSDVFGFGPVNGVCLPPVTPISCTSDGFTTDAAYGARARASLTYPDVLPAVEVTPSVIYGYDLAGWSYDGAFSEGRQFAVLGLRAEYQKRFAAEIAYIPQWGGIYNVTRDRDVMSFAVSAKF
jgi:hypothetical protein